MRDPIIPAAGGVIHVTLVGLGPGVDVAVQFSMYDAIVPNAAGDEGPPVMTTLMDWALAARKNTTVTIRRWFQPMI